MQHKTLCFIGAGNMSNSIIRGLLASGYPADKIMACNRTQPALDELADTQILLSLDNNEGLKFADAVVLAVKPQVMQHMCEQLAPQLKASTNLYISIAAGINLSRLQSMIDTRAEIVRVMPNTPSLLGRGMSGLYADNSVSDESKTFVQDMMRAVGQTLWVEQESDINTVIAAAGSSPAYFFLFLQIMQEYTVQLGLPKESARQLVAQAMRGAADMVCDNPSLELSALRAQVTSKGGTTAKAIESFLEAGLVDIVGQAMQAAVERAEQMEQEL